MDKQNILIGLNAVIIALLAIQLFSGSGKGGDSSSNAASSTEDIRSRALANSGGANPAGAPPTINPTNVQTQPAQTQPAPDPATLTAVKFAEEVFDFGTVKAGEPVEHVYKFTNTGDKPLTISNARGSCGCTVPDWPREPIAPGAEGEIKVRFDSKGKNGAQNKTVTVTANTEPQNTIIRITGDPNAAAKPADANTIQVQ